MGRPVSADVPGSQRTSGTVAHGQCPYLREIMDAISDPHVHEVVLKSSSQVGKTEVILNVLGYNIDYNPAPIFGIAADGGDGTDFFPKTGWLP